MLLKALKSAPRRFFDLIIPPQCFLCYTYLFEEDGLCADCWKKMTFLSSEAICKCCGYPFDYTVGIEILCGKCARQKPSFHQARSVFVYDDNCRELILRFKHGDAVYMVPTFTNWLSRVYKESKWEADLMIPVPLHWSRLLYRHYNQSALLIRRLKKSIGLPYAMNILVRHRRTPLQGQTSTNRFQNVKGAFMIKSKHISIVAGKSILLVDDVYTSGATLTTCADVLLKAGAKNIFALSLARVKKHFE